MSDEEIGAENILIIDECLKLLRESRDLFQRANELFVLGQAKLDAGMAIDSLLKSRIPDAWQKVHALNPEENAGAAG